MTENNNIEELKTKVTVFEGDLIEEYLRRGYNIGPVKKGTKDQYLFSWSEYQEKKATKKEVMAWRGQYSADWVMVCGKANNNIIVIDFDDPEIYEQYFSDFKKMLSRSPSGGYHLYIKAKKLPEPSNGFGGFLIDIKSQGSVCHIPPSEGNDWIYFESEPDEVKNSVEDWIESLLPSGKIESKFKANYFEKAPIPVNIISYAKDKLKITFEDKKGRYLKCTCPFHRGGQEKDGSLTIFNHDQKFWCFSCHKKGGLYELIKEFESGITEQEILDRYGLIKEPETIVQKVIKLAKDNCRFVKDQNNISYAVIEKNKEGIQHDICVINSKEYSYWLSDMYERVYEVFPSTNQANQASKHLEGYAIAKGERIKSCNRIGASSSKEVIYDIGDGRYLQITPEDISIIRNTNLFFRRESHQGVQVIPKKYEPKEVMKLFDIINVKDKRSKLLLIAWLVTALLPDEEHPILLLHGSQGAGKSVAARIQKRLIDPSGSEKNELSRLNKKDQNQMTFTMAHSLVTIFDNISSTDKEIDDILCLGVTGGAELKRALFTNSETVTTDIASTIILTTINPDLITVGDLGDRAISVELQRPVNEFLNKRYLDDKFDAIKPDIFGGLLALVQIYLQNRESLEKQPSRFRMTTFSACGKIVSETLKLGSFEDAYSQDQLNISKSVLDNEPLSQFIYYMADKFPNIEHSFGDLLKDMQEWANGEGINITMGRSWPQNIKSLSQKVKRLEEDIRKSWGISTKRVEMGKQRGVIFSKPGVGLMEKREEE